MIDIEQLPNKDYARILDNQDPLRSFRNHFYFPIKKNGEPYLYFCGNSLGLQPKKAKVAVENVLKDWKQLGVEGHFEGNNPWIHYHEAISKTMAQLVGAKPIEVAIMNTLTINLHMLLVSFYTPTQQRYKILVEEDIFPSDRYAINSHLEWHGHRDGLIELKARPGEVLLRTGDIDQVLERQGHEIALVLLGNPNYYTGQTFDLKHLATKAHEMGCLVGFDLAHGVGNIPLELHDAGIDFGIWCTYKYLNAGPGSIAGCFIHERHAHNQDLPRLAGWWGQKHESRFLMPNQFDPIPGAEGWQVSNLPILSLAPILASLEIFEAAGMLALRKKSILLTGYLEKLILNLRNSGIKIITPKNPEERGCQLSIQVQNADKSLFEKISSQGVILDWREPDVIRVAPTPLYNSFEDVYDFVEILSTCLHK